MTDTTNRLIAAALEQAGLKAATEGQYGRLIWKRGSTRFYGANRDGDAVLTVVRQGASATQYEIVGVRWEALS